jgi:hypothetical protein
MPKTMLMPMTVIKVALWRSFLNAIQHSSANL